MLSIITGSQLLLWQFVCLAQLNSPHSIPARPACSGSSPSPGKKLLPLELQARNTSSWFALCHIHSCQGTARRSLPPKSKKYWEVVAGITHISNQHAGTFLTDSNSVLENSPLWGGNRDEQQEWFCPLSCPQCQKLFRWPPTNSERKGGEAEATILLFVNNYF